MPTSSARPTSGRILLAEVFAPRRPTSSWTVATTKSVLGCFLPTSRRAVSAASAHPMRLSQALASSRLGFAITANVESGTIGSPGRMSSFFFTSQSLVAPTSMNMSLISITFLRSSSRSSCGGLLPTTPSTSPFLVLMTRRWPSTTWPHQPPRGRNLTKPSLVTERTRKPTSSRCPASITRGALASPAFSQMKLPRRSWLKSPTPLSCFCMTLATSSSKPGTPCASTSSLRNSSVRSMSTFPGVSSPGSGLFLFLMCGRAQPACVGERQVEHASDELVVAQALGLRRHRHQARGGETGNRVHLEHLGLVLLREAEVHADDAAAAQHGRALHGQLAQVAAQLL